MSEDQMTPSVSLSSLEEKFQAQLDDLIRTRHSYGVVTLDREELGALIEALKELVASED